MRKATIFCSFSAVDTFVLSHSKGTGKESMVPFAMHLFLYSYVLVRTYFACFFAIGALETCGAMRGDRSRTKYRRALAVFRRFAIRRQQTMKFSLENVTHSL